MAIIFNKEALQNLVKNTKIKEINLQGLVLPFINDGYEIEKRISELNFKKSYGHLLDFKEQMFKKVRKPLQNFIKSISEIPPTSNTIVSYIDIKHDIHSYEIRKLKLIEELAIRMCRIDFDYETFMDEDIEKKNKIKIRDLIKKEAFEYLDDFKDKEVNAITFAELIYLSFGGSQDLAWDTIHYLDAYFKNVEDIETYVTQKRIESAFKFHDEVNQKNRLDEMTEIARMSSENNNIEG